MNGQTDRQIKTGTTIGQKQGTKAVIKQAQKEEKEHEDKNRMKSRGKETRTQDFGHNCKDEERR